MMWRDATSRSMKSVGKKVVTSRAKSLCSMEKAVLWVLEAVATPNYPRTAFFFNHLHPYPNTDATTLIQPSVFEVSCCGL